MTIRDTLSQAVKLHQDGSLPEARMLYLEILNDNPDQADALNLLGVLCLQCQDYESALGYLKQAVRNDKKAPYYNNLGLVYKKLDELEDAQKQFETALTIDPQSLDSAINLASLWQDSGRINDAYDLLNAHYQQGITNTQYLFNFSTLCIKTGVLLKARASLEKLLVISPNDGGALFNYGMLLKNTGDIDAARNVFARLINHPSKGEKAKWFLSQCLLLQENFNEGWHYFSSRFKALDIGYKETNLPQWQIEDGKNKRLLVWAEQGIGDELLFATHLPLLTQQVSKLYFECDTRLKPLFERSYPSVHFFDRTNGPLDIKDDIDVDVQCAAGDLIRYTNPELKHQEGYFQFLKVDQQKAEMLKLPSSASLNIGLSYFTNGSNAEYRMPPEDFWEVLKGFGEEVNFVDLQSNQIRSFSPPASLVDNHLLTQIETIDLYNDIDSLAALISNLDCVISIDNAVAHLASNVGTPTMLLLSTIHDWRWLKNKQVLPWYPETRLIRQENEGDWDEVKAELHKCIAGLITQK